MKFETLDAWLHHIEGLHAQTIDLGLDRMETMLKRLNIRFNCPVFTVGGTNGKGSTCAFIESALLAGGYTVGVHTSPHLIRFNERVRINGEDAGDEDLIRQFEKVEAARGEMTLSYFEYTLLGILLLFAEKNLDAVVLEIGLGGRLDAVNAVEPSVSVITSIGIDHTAYLGKTRESIGWEKAHIYRPGKPAVCADANPPITVEQYSEKIGAQLLVIGRNFKFEHRQGCLTWNFSGSKGELNNLPLPTMPGEHQLNNASGAFEALQCLQRKLPLKREAFETALLKTRITGRFSKVRNAPEVYLDVGHNPHAAKELAKTLGDLPKVPRQSAVFGMLSDKDRAQVCRIMACSFDKWYVSDLEGPRGGTAEDLSKLLGEAGVAAEKVQSFKSVEEALARALEDARETDRIVTFGSFLTVASAVKFLKERVGRD